MRELLFVGIAVGASCAGAHVTTYRYMDLPLPAAFSVGAGNVASGINNAGQIVGNYAAVIGDGGGFVFNLTSGA